MSLEQYFNNKKSMVVSFLTHFQQLIHQLSIAVQLEIDNEYFSAKSLMADASRDFIEMYCRDMAAKESGLMANILDSVYQHVKGYQFTQLTVNNVTAPVARANPQKQQEIVNVVREPHMSRVMSLGRLAKSDQTTATKPKNIKGIATVTKNSQQLFNLKTASRQANFSAESSRIQKQYEPVNLLNKKRESSLRKAQQQPRMETESKQSMNYTKYRKEHSQQNAVSNPQTNRQNQSMSYNVYTMEEKREGGLQTNQILCETLDQKIHESAIQILNKVKPKRSPNRRKVYQSVNKVNRTINTFSLENAVPTRPNILRMRTEQRVPV